MAEKKEVNVIVCIDMQNDFVTGALANVEAQKIAPNVGKYIKDHRGDENTVFVFTRDSHFDNYLESAEGKKLPVPHCILNSKGWQIIDEIELKPTDIIVNKPNFGSFDIQNAVAAAVNIIRQPADEQEAFVPGKSLGFDVNITMFGVCTGICVASNATILKTAFPEANISIIKDLCACVTPESHKAALKTMEMQQINIV